MKKGNLFIKLVVILAALSLLAVALAPIIPLLIPAANGPSQEISPIDSDLDEIAEDLPDDVDPEPGDENAAPPPEETAEELVE